MSSPRFHSDGHVDMMQIQQALFSQTAVIGKELDSLRNDIKEVREDVQKLNKNIEKLVEILNQSNPRAKNIMIRSYSTSGLVSSFIK